MRKIRIALGSNDGETLVPDHMGMATYFYVYDLFEDGRWEPVERRLNTSPKSEKGRHGLAEKLKGAAAVFQDCDLVLSRRRSPNFVKMRDNSKFQPVLTGAAAIPDSLKALAEAFSELYELVEARRNGQRPKTIPIVGG